MSRNRTGRQGKKDLTREHCITIFKVYSYLKHTVYEDQRARNVQPPVAYRKVTANLCCVSEATVKNVVKRGRQDPTFAGVRTKRFKNKNAARWKGMNYDFLKHDIRIRMGHLYAAGEYPTVDNLMRFIYKQYSDLPRISESTFKIRVERRKETASKKS